MEAFFYFFKSNPSFSDPTRMGRVLVIPLKWDQTTSDISERDKLHGVAKVTKVTKVKSKVTFLYMFSSYDDATFQARIDGAAKLKTYHCPVKNDIYPEWSMTDEAWAQAKTEKLGRQEAILL